MTRQQNGFIHCQMGKALFEAVHWPTEELSVVAIARKVRGLAEPREASLSALETLSRHMSALELLLPLSRTCPFTADYNISLRLIVLLQRVLPNVLMQEDYARYTTVITGFHLLGVQALSCVSRYAVSGF